MTVNTVPAPYSTIAQVEVRVTFRCECGHCWQTSALDWIDGTNLVNIVGYCPREGCGNVYLYRYTSRRVERVETTQF